MRIWAKLESRNPTGSVKDRVARSLIEDAAGVSRLEDAALRILGRFRKTGALLERQFGESEEGHIIVDDVGGDTGRAIGDLVPAHIGCLQLLAYGGCDPVGQLQSMRTDDQFIHQRIDHGGVDRERRQGVGVVAQGPDAFDP